MFPLGLNMNVEQYRKKTLQMFGVSVSKTMCTMTAACLVERLMECMSTVEARILFVGIQPERLIAFGMNLYLGTYGNPAWLYVAKACVEQCPEAQRGAKVHLFADQRRWFEWALRWPRGKEKRES